jgi:hemerythrin
MSVRFIWNNSHSIGDVFIDQQHKEMFFLGDKILNDISSNVKVDFRDLLEYVRGHFSDEEGLMCKINYPKHEEHKEKHDDIIEKLNGLSDHSLNNSQFMSDFKEILSDWIDKHIKGQDKVLIDYFLYGKEPTHECDHPGDS